MEKQRKPMKKGYKIHHWTEAERQYLRDNFQEMTRYELAAHLGVTDGAIMNQAKRMKLVKTRDAIKRIAKRLSNSGQFIAGYTPLNTQTDGAITVREDKKTGVKTRWIRLSLNNWMELHRYNWIKAGNEIPPHGRIKFKDGDRMNCDISNLYLQEKSGRKPKPGMRAAQRKADRLEAELKRWLDRQEKRDAQMAERDQLRAERDLARQQAKEQAGDKATKGKAYLKQLMKQLDPAADKKKADQEAKRKAKGKLKAIAEKKAREKDAGKEKKFETRAIDTTQLIPLQIDSNTRIYIKPGQDPDKVLAKFRKPAADKYADLPPTYQF